MLNNKKAAKKLLKRAKAHPDWYTNEDVKYAKKIKKNIKDENRSPNRNPIRPTISTGAKKQNATTAAGLSSFVVSKPR